MFFKTFAEDFFPKQNVKVFYVFYVFQETFCCFNTLNTELTNLLSGFNFLRDIISRGQLNLIKIIDWEEYNRQPKFFFQKLEFRFETPTTRPFSTLLPLLKHGNFGVPVKMFEMLVNFLSRVSCKGIKFIYFAFHYQWHTYGNSYGNLLWGA